MASDAGHGTTLTFGGFTAALLSVNGWEFSREAVETTTMATTTWKTFIPSDLTDPGTITATVEHDPAISPPITGATGAVSIAWAGGASWSATGYLVSYTGNASGSEERMTADLTIKITSTVTF